MRVREKESERETGRACPVPPCRLFSQLANHSSEFPQSFSLPVFTCAPDTQLPPERTLQGKKWTSPQWNRNTAGQNGEENLSHLSSFPPFFLTPFFLASPPLLFLSRCLSTVSEGIEGQKNEDYYFCLALSRGVFRPLGAGDGGFPQFSADR